MKGQESSPPVTPERIMQFAWGYSIPLMLEAAIEIGLFLVNADRTGSVNGLIFAVNMLVNTQKGDTFSFEEIGEWLKEAGFVNVRLLEAPGPSPLILAEKA